MLLGAYSAHLELLQPRRGVPWASLMLDTQQCQLQESLQAPTRKVLGTAESPGIYYSQGCPGGGQSCQEEGQAGAWRLVSVSAGPWLCRGEPGKRR